MEVGGTINDIQIADCLLDEEQPEGYSLEAISRRWLGTGKDETLLRAAAENWGLDAKRDLWRLPAQLVGAYAEQDATATLAIWQKQKHALKDADLWEVYQVERELTPILFEMYWQGIRVDPTHAAQLNARWKTREDELRRALAGVDLWSAASIARFCDKEGIGYPRTATGKPSITKEYLEASSHPKLKQLQEARAINRVREIYLEENLIRNVFRGRIHPQYIQMASDDGGTRTMRLAARNPNAQQFPKRSSLFDAKSLRKCLLPEDQCEWAKFDYWSQEPVIQLHYALQANLPGAKEVCEQFKQGIKLYTFIEKATNGRCNYDQAKAVALGRSYGMGKDKMADTLNMSPDQCAQILHEFDQVVPYISLLSSAVSNKAQQRGFIRTLLGHRRHFNLWQPAGKKYESPLPADQAKAKWPDHVLQRAYTHKAFNSLIQGGAAGQTKKALVMIAKEIRLPQMTVHDEISVSIQSAKEADQIDEIMCTCIPLQAPVRTDRTISSHWS